MSVHDRDHPERFLTGRVGDQIIPHSDEAKGTAGEIVSMVAAMRKRNQMFKGGANVCYHPVRSGYAIACDVVPNLIEIDFRIRVEIIPGPGLPL